MAKRRCRRDLQGTDQRANVSLSSQVGNRSVLSTGDPGKPGRHPRITEQHQRGNKNMPTIEEGPTGQPLPEHWPAGSKHGQLVFQVTDQTRGPRRRKLGWLAARTKSVPG